MEGTTLLYMARPGTVMDGITGADGNVRTGGDAGPDCNAKAGAGPEGNNGPGGNADEGSDAPPIP